MNGKNLIILTEIYLEIKDLLGFGLTQHEALDYIEFYWEAWDLTNDIKTFDN